MFNIIILYIMKRNKTYLILISLCIVSFILLYINHISQKKIENSNYNTVFYETDIIKKEIIDAVQKIYSLENRLYKFDRHTIQSKNDIYIYFRKGYSHLISKKILDYLWVGGEKKFGQFDPFTDDIEEISSLTTSNIINYNLNSATLYFVNIKEESGLVEIPHYPFRIINLKKTNKPWYWIITNVSSIKKLPQ